MLDLFCVQFVVVVLLIFHFFFPHFFFFLNSSFILFFSPHLYNNKYLLISLWSQYMAAQVASHMYMCNKWDDVCTWIWLMFVCYIERTSTCRCWPNYVNVLVCARARLTSSEMPTTKLYTMSPCAPQHFNRAHHSHTHAVFLLHYFDIY